MSSRTTDDYQAMAAAGIVAIIEPAFWLGQPRTSVGSFIDYFSSLIGWERFRASQFGIKHYCTIGLNSKEANDEALAEEVLDILPRFATKDGVVAIGEIGYDDITDAEDKAFRAQLTLAKELSLPVMVHTPHRDKVAGTIRSMEVCEEMGLEPHMVVIDHNNEETVQAVLDRGFWAAFTLYPQTKMGSERMVEVIKRFGSGAHHCRQLCRLGRQRPIVGTEDGQSHAATRHSPKLTWSPAATATPSPPTVKAASLTNKIGPIPNKTLTNASSLKATACYAARRLVSAKYVVKSAQASTGSYWQPSMRGTNRRSDRLRHW